MRVIGAHGTPGFVGGGASELANSLGAALISAGHEVEMLPVHFDESSDTLSQLAGLRAHDLTPHADRLIALRWPAHYLRHDRKIVGFLHEFRPLFDLADQFGAAGSLGMLDDSRAADLECTERTALGESHRVFANSRVVAERIGRNIGSLPVEVLEPPFPREMPPEATEAERSRMVQLGRVASIKRQHLAIEACAASSDDWKLTIAGVPEPAAYGLLLEEMVRDLGVEERVDLRLRWITEQEKIELLGTAFGVFNLAMAEDSYSYVTYEAWASGLPVITMRDTEGIVEAVERVGAGVVCDVSPGALAEAADALSQDRSRGRELGSTGRDWVTSGATTWPEAVARLLAH